MVSAYKVGDFVIADRAYTQDHLNGHKFRGRIVKVHGPDPNRKFWYEVELIDLKMEAICYDDELERDLLQELADA